MKLHDIASTKLISIRPSDSPDTAIALMEEHDIHHLPVVVDGRPGGIVSDRDLLQSVGWMQSRERTDCHDGQVVGPRTVREIMSAPVHTLTPDAPIEDAARLMLQERIGAVGVVVEDQLTGLVAESDVLRCFVDDRMEFGTSRWRFEKVIDHMSPNVFSLQGNDPIMRATRLMKDKSIRHVPIVTHDHVIGVVSDRDIRKACFREQMEWLTSDEPPEQTRTNLEDVLSPHPVRTLPHSTLAEAASLMIEFRIGALPVVEHGSLCGIITESDLLHAFLRAET